MIEWVMLRQHETEHLLRLLALIGQGVGHKGLPQEYATPQEEWADTVESLGWTPGQVAASRQAAVRAFVDAAEA